jgi:hypothetical protein
MSELTAEQIIADTLVRFCIRDGEPKFVVVVDDPASETYGVDSTSYVDADRAGYVGDVTTTIVKNLTQMQAVRVVWLLNEAKLRLLMSPKGKHV